jgi:hypothetical protein
VLNIVPKKEKKSPPKNIKKISKRKIGGTLRYAVTLTQKKLAMQQQFTARE